MASPRGREETKLVQPPSSIEDRDMPEYESKSLTQEDPFEIIKPEPKQEEINIEGYFLQPIQDGFPIKAKPLENYISLEEVIKQLTGEDNKNAPSEGEIKSILSIIDSYLKTFSSFIIPYLSPIFSFFIQEQEEQAKSAHEVKQYVKKKYEAEIKKLIPQIAKSKDAGCISSYLHFFKEHHAPGSPISEVEAANYGFCYFLAPDNVPAAHPIYNQHGKFIGVITKAIKKFKPNKVVRLESNDTVIQAINTLKEEEILITISDEELREKQESRLLYESTLQALLEYLKKIAYSQQSWLDTFKKNKMVKKAIGLVYDVPKKENVIEKLETFLNKKNTCAEETYMTLTNEILDCLTSRKKHVKALLNKDLQKTDINHINEKPLLQIATDAAKAFVALTNKAKKIDILIQQFEKIDQIQKKKNTDIDILQPDMMMTESIDGEVISISVSDLINYRIIKGQAVGLSTRYLIRDPDGHNRNMDKYGHIIDFDNGKAKVTYEINRKDKKIINKVCDQVSGRVPNKNSFTPTKHDIKHFPIIKNPDYFWWVTNKASIIRSSSGSIPGFSDLGKNTFSEADNAVFEKLATNPIFIFHKFKTFLKYVLFDEVMYRSNTKLYLRDDLEPAYEDHINPTLLEQMTNDELINIQKVREALVSMKEFKQFLKAHGKFVFNIIEEEFMAYKLKYIDKQNKYMTNHQGEICPDYQNLIDAIDIDKIKDRYNTVCRDAEMKSAALHDHYIHENIVAENPILKDAVYNHHQKTA